MTNDHVAVVGATGHTGRFVVTELLGRGYVPCPIGRDPDRLAAAHPHLDARVASPDDAAALDRALTGAAAVVNCAGPFATTAGPVLGAALRAGIPYVDVAAEIEAVLDTLGRTASVPVAPAMAFFGGLGDLLVTAAMGDWTAAGEAHIAYGLSGWHPTAGTLAAGAVSRERRAGRRVRWTGGRLAHHTDELPVQDWEFPAPMGRRPVLGEFSMADIVTVPSHLAIPEVRTYLTTAAAADLAAPVRERTAETFTVDVVVRSGGNRRRVAAHGRDIYAVSAPIAVEAVHRILGGRTRASGAASAGAMFDAADFLDALAGSVRWGPVDGGAV